ncbi:MAG: hypothetical protein AB1742_11210 [bacterium]
MTQNGSPAFEAKKRRVWARVTRAEAERLKDGAVQNIELHIQLDDVLSNKNLLEIRFTFTAWYKPALGHLTMKGVLIMESDEGESEKIASNWTEHKTMDEELAGVVMHNINYKCGTEAILVTKLVDLPAPIVPPRVRTGGRKPPETPAPGRIQ